MSDKAIPLFPVPPLTTIFEQDNRSCMNCANLNRSGPYLSCKAFPNGIPLDIQSGETPHINPIEGDNGIQWEAAPDAPTGPGLPSVDAEG